MNKYTITEIYNDLLDLDVQCCYIALKKNQILFDNDDRGNGTQPYYFLIVNKDSCKIGTGLLLTKKDKKVFKFKDYDTLQNLTDAIVEFNKHYFKSFKLTRK